MYTLSIRTTLDAAVDAVWHIVSDFGNARFLPFEILEASGHGPGATRRIRTPDGTRMVDRLDVLDHPSRTVRYSLDSAASDPGPMTRYEATMRLYATGDGRTDVEWSGQVELEPHMDAVSILPMVLTVYLAGIASIRSMLLQGDALQ
jgi:hypothetical protein